VHEGAVEVLLRGEVLVWGEVLARGNVTQPRARDEALAAMLAGTPELAGTALPAWIGTRGGSE
jgi:hypothetical protein